MFIVLSLVLSAFMQCWCKDIKKGSSGIWSDRSVNCSLSGRDSCTCISFACSSHRTHRPHRSLWPKVLESTERIDAARHTTEGTLSLQKKAIRLNNQGKTMIAKDSFVPLL